MKIENKRDQNIFAHIKGKKNITQIVELGKQVVPEPGVYKVEKNVTRGDLHVQRLLHVAAVNARIELLDIACR